MQGLRIPGHGPQKTANHQMVGKEIKKRKMFFLSPIKKKKRHKGLTQLDQFKDQGAGFCGLKVSHRTHKKM